MNEEEEELLRQHRLFRDDPLKFLAFAEDAVRKNPKDPHAYFLRYQAWSEFGRLDLALRDLNT
ncbi:MAG TPA: hypothetical protein VET85_13910, partial [Stellaceae bacterium]|nr:hypothetical protein [Stellaceae bacterium]